MTVEQKVKFRFTNINDAERFYDELLMGFAFVGSTHVARNFRPNVMTVSFYTNRRHHIKVANVLAWEHESFFSMEITTVEGQE
jgi:hypothetical protein